MDTRIITIPNIAKSADEAIARNKALPPSPPPYGTQLCCGTVPQMRKGGATITTITCPACGREKGCWSLSEDFAVQCWNEGGWGKPRIDAHGETTDILCIHHVRFEYMQTYREFPTETRSWQMVSVPQPGLFRFHDRRDLSKYRELTYQPGKQAHAYANFSMKGKCIVDHTGHFSKETEGIHFFAGNHKWSKVLREFLERN